MSTGAVFIDLKKAFDLVDHEWLLYRRTLWSKRKQFGLVPKLSYDTNTKSNFWEALVFLPTHPVWCSAGLNSMATSFCFIHK